MLPDGFLGVDGILNIVANVVDGIQIWPHVILKHVMAELPFMATENILMECVKVSSNRIFFDPPPPLPSPATLTALSPLFC